MMSYEMIAAIRGVEVEVEKLETRLAESIADANDQRQRLVYVEAENRKVKACAKLLEERIPKKCFYMGGNGCQNVRL